MILGIIIRQRLKDSQVFYKAKVHAHVIVPLSVLHASWCPVSVAVVHLNNRTKCWPFSLNCGI